MLSFLLQEVLPKIIHVSQIGFMGERSIIMDNVLTFWEATAVAMQNKQNLAMLFVGFWESVW